MGWPEMVDGAGEAGAEDSPAEEAETAGGAGEASAPEVAGSMAEGSSPTALGWGLGCWFGEEEGEVVLVGLAEAGWVRLEVEDSDMGANGVDDGACWVEDATQAVVEPGEAIIFRHDFPHLGASDARNWRLFFSFGSNKSNK